MSTFDGFVSEFPNIRIDHFRTRPDSAPVLACFLSHVHSDHLAGLESLKSPFVYCSATTRQILLGLERYPHRMNFAKGILESRKQTYRSLHRVLKPIPLETPTTIELAPGKEICVTFFDANHCPGAVSMFIQAGGKAVLYTGDIRSEQWWVEKLKRHPILVPYTQGNLRIDSMYLDTTFATKSNIHRKFPSKAEGLAELLEKLRQYPKSTPFYFHSWTFGYEEVWMALATYLGSQIHLDRYRSKLYTSLRDASLAVPCPEAPALIGFHLGNHYHEGCLTDDESVRLHSCERGTGCSIWDGLNSQNLVQIVPIVTRTRDGVDVAELGIGGGKGDLDQTHEIELGDDIAVEQLVRLCEQQLGSDSPEFAEVLRFIAAASDDEKRRILLSTTDTAMELDRLPLPKVVEVLNSMATRSLQADLEGTGLGLRAAPVGNGPNRLASTITFPYSRHSSYDELCDLVTALRPKDIYPCTVDLKTWDPSRSMRALFGHLCSTDTFAHDREMFALYDARAEFEHGRKRHLETQDESQLSTSDHAPESMSSDVPQVKRARMGASSPVEAKVRDKTPETAIWIGSDNHEPQHPDVLPSSPPVAVVNAPADFGDARTNDPHSFPRDIPLRSSQNNADVPVRSPVLSSPFTRAQPAPLFNDLEATTPSKSKRAIPLPTDQAIMKQTAQILAETTRMRQALANDLAVPSSDIEPTTNTERRVSSSRRIFTSEETTIRDKMKVRQLARQAAVNIEDDFSWWDFGGLISAGNDHGESETEL